MNNLQELAKQLNSLPSLEQIEAEILRRKRSRLATMFPDSGAYRRELYPKHCEFFAAGALHRERLFLAGNRTGKTVAGAFEISCHATGRYPHWWTGRRIEGPELYWVAGDTSKTVRDILQLELLGPPGQYGVGMLPFDCIARTTAKTGIGDAVEGIYVKHVRGGESLIMMKSYDQRREAFQGSKPICCWLDEETSIDIYAECVTRTLTNGGFILSTFTPLKGVTPLVQLFANEDGSYGSH